MYIELNLEKGNRAFICNASCFLPQATPASWATHLASEGAGLEELLENHEILYLYIFVREETSLLSLDF